jgi:hypothetical protein
VQQLYPQVYHAAHRDEGFVRITKEHEARRHVASATNLKFVGITREPLPAARMIERLLVEGFSVPELCAVGSLPSHCNLFLNELSLLDRFLALLGHLKADVESAAGRTP